MGKSSLEELLALYADLERSIRRLRSVGARVREQGLVAAIDARKLLAELMRSKEEVELRIKNNYLIEKGRLERKLRNAADESLAAGSRVLRVLREKDNEEHGPS